MQTLAELVILLSTVSVFAYWFTRPLDREDRELGLLAPRATGSSERHYAWNRAPRHRFHCDVDFVDERQKRGQGRVLDISRSGWRIRSSHPITPGMVLRLTLRLPDAQEPLEIDRTLVRWSDGREFGLDLLTMNPLAAARLSELFPPSLDEQPLVAKSHLT
ncbi:MAG: PilZ domain-containing protein [Nitrospiraceae bacterium]|nr:PilZ domain-containing protein [Nitrospiraceae bacterium]